MLIKKTALRRRLSFFRKTQASSTRRGPAAVKKKVNKRVFLCLIGLFIALSIAACLARPSSPAADQQPAAQPPGEARELVRVWTTLPQEAVQELFTAYQANHDDNRQYQVSAVGPDALPTIGQLPAGERPQLLFAASDELSPLVADKTLLPIVTEASDMIPPGLHDENYFWTGLWVDPYVLAINRPYSRQVGQLSLSDWQDILYRTKPSLAICDPIAVADTAAFFYAWASHSATADVYEELAALHALTKQYSRFAATPVKLVGMGDSDVAITLSSTVVMNKDKQYPLYTYRPPAGAPVRVLALAVVIGENPDRYGPLLDWMLETKPINRSLEDKYGWLSVQEAVEQLATADAWWTNTKYLERDKQQVFMRTWLERIRFGK